jgi:hypothetical protein
MYHGHYYFTSNHQAIESDSYQWPIILPRRIQTNLYNGHYYLTWPFNNVQWGSNRIHVVSVADYPTKSSYYVVTWPWQWRSNHVLKCTTAITILHRPRTRRSYKAMNVQRPLLYYIGLVQDVVTRPWQWRSNHKGKISNAIFTTAITLINRHLTTRSYMAMAIKI